MLLKSSCHCQAVRFSVHTHHPYPFMYCYCSICRKTAGGGGYAINLAGDNTTLEVECEEHISVYRALIQNPEDLQPCRAKESAAFAVTAGHAYGSTILTTLT